MPNVTRDTFEDLHDDVVFVICYTYLANQR